MNVYEKLEYLESKGWRIEEIADAGSEFFKDAGFKWIIYYSEDYATDQPFDWNGCGNLNHLINYSFDEYIKWEKKNGSETKS